MSTTFAKPVRHRHQQPLDRDILASGPLRTRSKKRKAKRDEDENEGYIDSRTSRKILKIGAELEEEEQKSRVTAKPNIAFTFDSRIEDDDIEDEPNNEDDEGWGDEEEEVEVDEIDPQDLATYNKFIPSGEEPTLDLKARPPAEGEGTNLADLILQKIALHEEEHAQLAPSEEGAPEEIPPKVQEVYRKVGLILSRYKSSTVPKPFKILPSLPQWEDLLALTRPDDWTPNAAFEATRIFVSTNKVVAKRFLESVLLDQVREDIRENRTLNVHYFNALRKATFRPEAFFKGLIFPLIESSTCTLREAHIISGVLTRAALPVLHSAAALMRLTDIISEQASASNESGGAANIFIKALLLKQYALPYKVIDNLVFHFLRFRGNSDAMDDDSVRTSKDIKLPVLWHQTLLAFASRYKNDISEDQREALLDLLINKGHKDIGPEIRKELLAGRGRGVPLEEKPLDSGDDTMKIDPA